VVATKQSRPRTAADSIELAMAFRLAGFCARVCLCRCVNKTKFQAKNFTDPKYLLVYFAWHTACSLSKGGTFQDGVVADSNVTPAPYRPPKLPPAFYGDPLHKPQAGTCNSVAHLTAWQPHWTPVRHELDGGLTERASP
jgi:hypothetical protein